MNAARFLPLPRHGADGRTLVFIGLGLLVAAGNWTGIFRNVMSVPLGYLLAFIACTATHNQMHLPVFRSGFWNSLYQIALSFAIGQPPTGFITAHNIRHHKHAESDLDFVRTSLAGFRSNALNIVFFPFIAIATMYREKKSDLADWKAKRPRLFRQALIERSVFYAVVGVLLVADWRSTLLFLFLPWISAQVVLVGMNLLQHQDCDSGSEYDHSRNLTGKTANFFLLNSGYHTAHHLRPAMHWSKLPEYHEREIAPRINPSLNHRSLLGLLAERVRRPRLPHAEKDINSHFT
jgi:beta-carotene hydroxylase